jgi:hypothetical protein
MHEYPFMNAYNPYSFYNVWQNPPYFQMPHQQIGLQYQTDCLCLCFFGC